MTPAVLSLSDRHAVILALLEASGFHGTGRWRRGRWLRLHRCLVLAVTPLHGEQLVFVIGLEGSPECVSGKLRLTKIEGPSTARH